MREGSEQGQQAMGVERELPNRPPAEAGTTDRVQ